MDAPAPDYANVDYCQQSISSIDAVQKLVAEDPNLLRLNDQQCRYLAKKLTETGLFLRAKSPDSLVKIRDSTDIRRMPLLHLHFAVKRAEKLVRGCCCEGESWLEAAVTLSHVKETIKDILLDLRWWTSMVDIAITSVKGKSSRQTTRLLEILESAEEDFEKVLKELHTPNNGLVRAASEDESELLGKVREVDTSFAGGGRSAAQKHEYLLAVHVRSRLENSEAETAEDLNEYEDAKLIGFGGFGVVQDVRWMRRRCALKILNRTCKEEATKLRNFQHPHIVKYFRYFEAPFRQTPNGTPRDTPQGTPGSDSGPVYRGSSQSHILMELLQMDLSQYLGKLQDTASFTVGSKGKPEHIGGAPLPVDVALDVMLQIVKAMWHLNSKDVAHRDVIPNLLVRPVSFDEVPELTARGYLWAELASFGLARTEAFSYAYSSLREKIGTKMYGAPEVFDADIISEASDPRKVDVWSFGIIFCEVLTGKPPFPGVADGTMRMTILQEKIKKGLRPKLPENCPDYLKFIIESCWHLKPEDRPNFGDLWRLMRIAQAQSLGLIQKDHDLFFYRPRTGLKKFRSVVKRITPPAPPSPGPLPISEGITPSGPSIWMLVLRWISSNLARKRGLGFQPRSSSKRGNSKSREVSVSRPESECKPLGYLVNQLVPLDEDISASKLDVIFFEGNVGRRRGLSCKDTWVQRNNPDVWWPRDWLPKDLGDDIRVLMLEYSISDDGVERVLDQLQRLLVFSVRWNRKDTWERPIVLVGHSLGCVMIEHLVVALDRKTKFRDEVEIGRAKVAKAFLTNLAGCFFYAPPWRGLVRSDDLLTYVFGGLTYSEGLFADLCLDSPMLKSLSEVFVQVKPEHMKLTALIEGFHTKGNVVPPGSMLGFDGTVVELEESNHIDVCKPTDKRHVAYRVVLGFIAEVLEARTIDTAGGSIYFLERPSLHANPDASVRQPSAPEYHAKNKGFDDDYRILGSVNSGSSVSRRSSTDSAHVKGTHSQPADQHSDIHEDQCSMEDNQNHPCPSPLAPPEAQQLVYDQGVHEPVSSCQVVPQQAISNRVQAEQCPVQQQQLVMVLQQQQQPSVAIQVETAVAAFVAGSSILESVDVLDATELTDKPCNRDQDQEESYVNYEENYQKYEKNFQCSYEEDYQPRCKGAQPQDNQGSSELAFWHQAKNYKISASDQDFDKDESYTFVESLDDAFGVNIQLPRELKGPSMERPSYILEEDKELYGMLKEKISEIVYIADMQQADAMGYISSESDVLIICNHNDKDDTLVFHFQDGQSMAKVVGVGLDYAKVILRDGVDIEVQEVLEVEWESAWSHSSSMENTLYKPMKVKIPMKNDIDHGRALNLDDENDMARPLLWDVARYFTMQKILASLCNSDPEQSSKDGPGQGSGREFEGF